LSISKPDVLHRESRFLLDLIPFALGFADIAGTNSRSGRRCGLTANDLGHRGRLGAVGCFALDALKRISRRANSERAAASKEKFRRLYHDHAPK